MRTSAYFIWECKLFCRFAVKMFNVILRFSTNRTHLHRHFQDQTSAYLISTAGKLSCEIVYPFCWRCLAMSLLTKSTDTCIHMRIRCYLRKTNCITYSFWNYKSSNGFLATLNCIITKILLTFTQNSLR